MPGRCDGGRDALPVPTRRRGTAQGAAALTVLLPAWLAGCGNPDEGPPRSLEPASSVRDSAGVEIIEGLRPAWEGEEAWTVAGSPRVTIGEAEGAEEYLLDRVTGAVLLSDGFRWPAHQRSGALHSINQEEAEMRTSLPSPPAQEPICEGGGGNLQGGGGDP